MTCYRVYHQIQVWKVENIGPIHWGLLMPITMIQDPAKENLPKVIRLGCKIGCKMLTCLLAYVFLSRAFGHGRNFYQFAITKKMAGCPFYDDPLRTDF